jgi:hypothetical protein
MVELIDRSRSYLASLLKESFLGAFEQNYSLGAEADAPYGYANAAGRAVSSPLSISGRR